jgi:hypothetical protein
LMTNGPTAYSQQISGSVLFTRRFKISCKIKNNIQ